jgi:hypothetical protein
VSVPIANNGRPSWTILTAGHGNSPVNLAFIGLGSCIRRPGASKPTARFLFSKKFGIGVPGKIKKFPGSVACGWGCALHLPPSQAVRKTPPGVLPEGRMFPGAERGARWISWSIHYQFHAPVTECLPLPIIDIASEFTVFTVVPINQPTSQTPGTRRASFEGFRGGDSAWASGGTFACFEIAVF